MTGRGLARRKARSTRYFSVPRAIRSPSAPTNSGVVVHQGASPPAGERPLVGVACGAGVQVGLGCRTNVHCPRGVRIKLRREDFCVLQQSEP